MGLAGGLASDPHSPPPLQKFLQAILWATFFSIWLGSADPWWRPKEWALFSVGLSWLCWGRFSVSCSPKRRLSLYPSLLFGWVCLQFLLQQVLPIVKTGEKFASSPWPWVVFLQLLVIWVWFTDAIQTLELPDFKPIARTLARIGAILSLYMVSQAAGFDPLLPVSKLIHSDIRWLHGNHVIGLMGNPFQAAACLAVCIPFLVALRWHLWAILSLVAILATQSTSGALAALGGVWIVLWSQKRTLTLRIYSVVLVGLIAYAVQHGLYLQMYGRPSILVETFSSWFKEFWTGVGLGNYKLLGIIDPTPPGYAVRWAHNEWAQLGTELGVIGLILTVLWMAKLFRASRTKWRAIPAEWIGAGTATILLTPLNIPWHLAPTVCVTLLSLAVWTITVNQEVDASG